MLKTQRVKVGLFLVLVCLKISSAMSLSAAVFFSSSTVLGIGNGSFNPTWVNNQKTTLHGGTDRLLVVVAEYEADNLNGPNPFTSSLTVNGVPLTYLNGINGHNGTRASYQELWYMIAPPVGILQTIKWSTNNSAGTSPLVDSPSIILLEFTGVDQAHPFGAVGTIASGTSSLAQFDITTNYPNSYILHSWNGWGTPLYSAIPLPASAHQLLQGSNSAPTFEVVAGYDAPTPGHYQAAIQPNCGCNNSIWCQTTNEIVASGAVAVVPPPSPPINLGTGAMGSAYSYPHSGDPVNLVSGNYYFRAQDTRIQRPGLPIEFERFYNSQAVAIDAGYKGPAYMGQLTQPNLASFFDEGVLPGGVSGPLGFGWSHSYNAHLIFRGPTPAQIFMPDGSIVPLATTAEGFEIDPSMGATFTMDTVGYVLTFKDGTVWNFNLSGQLMVMEDRNGNVVSLSYADGLLSAVKDTEGEVILSFSYNSNHLIQTMADVLGRVWNYSYDSIGNLTGVAYPAGPPATYAYDQYSNLTQVSDPKAPKNYRQVENTYGVLHDPGNGYYYHPYVTQQKNGLGQIIATYSYGANGATFGSAATVTNGNGNVTVSTFTTGKTCTIAGSAFFGKPFGNGMLSTQTNALGQVGSIQYNDPRNPYKPSVTLDREGHSTTFTYDDHGNLIHLLDATGASSTFAFDPIFNLASGLTDPNGHTKTLGDQDSQGNFRQATDGLGHHSSSTFDSRGRRTSMTDADGHAWALAYDGHGNLFMFTDPLGHSTIYSRDAAGRTLSVQDPNNKVTSFSYDALDRIVQVTYPDGSHKGFGYDDHGNLVTSADQNGSVTQYLFDSADRLKQVIDPLGHVTGFTYDTVGNQLTMVDANGHETSYTYDALNRRKTATDAMGKVKTYAYTAEDRLSTITDGNGHVRHLFYDADGRVIGDDMDSYAYDAAGRRISMGVGSAQTIYTYDASDHLTRMLQPGGITTDYTYDADGQRIGLDINGNGPIQSITYQYDDANRLTGLTSDDGQTQFSYDNAGNLLFQLDPNGLKISREIDPNNYRVLALSNLNAEGEVLMAFKYTYDGVGNRLTESDLLGENNFQYDGLDQLTRVQDSLGNTVAFSYDAVGNRLSVTRNGQGETYVPDPANELQSVAGIARTFDGNGNLIQDGGSSLGWDTKDRLTSVGNVNYSYNGDNLRVLKSVNGIQTERYYFDGIQTLLVLDGVGGIKERYNPGVSFVNSDGERFYYLYNAHGDVVGLSDKSGSLVQNYRYEAYGRQEGGLNDRFNRHRYAGGSSSFSDEDTGLIYMVNRWFDPKTGTFVSRDPIGLAGGAVNLYSYVGNNPGNRLDPTGLSWLSDVFGGGCGGGGWNLNIFDGLRQLGQNFKEGISTFLQNQINGSAAIQANINNGTQRLTEAYQAGVNEFSGRYHEIIPDDLDLTRIENWDTAFGATSLGAVFGGIGVVGGATVLSATGALAGAVVGAGIVPFVASSYGAVLGVIEFSQTLFGI